MTDALRHVWEYWHLEDGEDGWYVVSPWGGRCGPFTEDAGAAKMRELRAYPVWCPSCLVPMEQAHDLVAHKFNGLWRCPGCGLEVEQDEIARMIWVNE